MISDLTTVNISNLFRATRKFNRLQQTEMAAILEVTQGTISKIESGNMHPELSLWFKFLRAFNISDPYCFKYGSLEFSESVFLDLQKNGSSLLPSFQVETDKTIFTIRMIRPIFDYIVKNHFKAFEVFLKKHKISIEVFYILNHPLTFNFAETFFSFLLDVKINEKSMALLNLNFDSSYGVLSSNSFQENSPGLFIDVLNNDKQSLVKYKLDEILHNYTVRLNKKSQSQLDDSEAKNIILNYNLLYPYYYLKSTSYCKVSPPVITELKENTEWKISYAG